MRIEQEMAIRKKIRRKEVDLPEFVADFIYVSDTSKSISTCFEYLKDITLFFEFLVIERKVSASSTKDITVKDLNRLDERHFVDFMNYLTQYEKTFTTPTGKVVTQTYSNRSEGKNRKLATLRVFFDYLFQKEMVDKNVTQRIDMKVNKRAKIKNRLTDAEIERFFHTILEDVNIESDHAGAYNKKTKFRDYVITVILAYCGVRVSEITQMNTDDIFIEEQSLIVLRKGGNEQAIPVPDAIWNIVEEYAEERANATNIQKGHEKALFLSLQNRRIHQRTIRNMLEKYRERCGLSIKITPHVFRRTFGTNHYNAFHDMYLTALVLGHSSAETTRKFYADPNEERVRKSMASFQYGDSADSSDQNQLERIADNLGIPLENLQNM